MTLNTCYSLTLDVKQTALLEELKEIALELNKLPPLFNIFNKKNLKNGLYLYGPVGSGKTMLMNSFFELLTISKIIIHYQNFMQEIHKAMHKLQSENESKNNIIPKIAKNYAKKTKVLCIDEFEIKDITDAMIIGNLLTELIKQGVFIFVTSNTKPDNLYKDGLQKESFLPFIAKINDEFYIKVLDHNHDYRFDKALEIANDRIIYPITPENQGKLTQVIKDITEGYLIPQTVEVLGREISFKQGYKKVLVTNFEELFTRNLSYIDYVNICQKFNIIIVEDVQIVSPDNTDIAVRFINFIDNAYFYKILLFMTLEDAPEKIYQGTARREEFRRTVSRLQEMNSNSYIS
ncbi:cell division protein ZapE [Rickettsia endosymbiont of Halotydeus destructor]|uniref:cell division protein ZapE n=1 Tax=Rickettsia endosymbiont of Halotydeus destructor TaxID=2996754 RepID=UPI003BB0B93B